jgi:hypothetical protein
MGIFVDDQRLVYWTMALHCEFVDVCHELSLSEPCYLAVVRYGMESTQPQSRRAQSDGTLL